MSRRQRHLNPASAGATLALDARFIFGLADSDPVDTWASRRPATVDATGVTTARPFWQSNGINGLPACLFDGSNDSLNTGTTFNEAETTYMAVAVRAAAVSGNKCILGNRQSSSGGRTWRTTATGLWATQISNPTVQLTMAVTSPFVASVQASSSGNFFGVNANGGNFASTTYGYGTSPNSMFIGNQGAISEVMQGYIAAVVIWPTLLSDPLRRRFEQAFATSFRLSL